MDLIFSVFFFILNIFFLKFILYSFLVHYDDLEKANITKDFLKTAKLGNVIRFTFTCMSYIGKYNKSRKAVDLTYIPTEPEPHFQESYNPYIDGLQNTSFTPFI